jgi:hypothetical protein
VNRRLPRVVGSLLGLALLSVASAAPPAIAQTEINYLLGFLESSGCEFYRNGSWYDSKRAQAHLRDKYEMLAAADQINTAEEFIEKAATKSSLSGRPYQVRCRGSEAVSTSQWLHEALVRYRAQAELGAPRPTRGARRTDASVQTRTSIVLHDLDVAVNHLHVFSLTRNGLGLVCRCLGSGAAGQPHDPILVRVDMNAP